MNRELVVNRKHKMVEIAFWRSMHPSPLNQSKPNKSKKAQQQKQAHDTKVTSATKARPTNLKEPNTS